MLEAMESLSSIVLDLAKALWDPFKRHAAYLLCAGRHVHHLQTRLEALEQRRREVQLDVDAALRSGRFVRDDASSWLARVDAIASEAKALADKLTLAQSSAGTRSAPCLRYGISREAVAKLAMVDELQRGGSFPEGVSRAPPPLKAESLLPTVDFEAFDSTKRAMKRVQDALQDARVRIVGVYGMAGVGKTTLMKEVAKAAVRDELSDEVVMVTVSQNPDTKSIQREICCTLGLEFVSEESEAVRSARLAARLKQARRPLLIFDDMWERLELVDVGIRCGRESSHPDCKVVITTRSRDVCCAMEVQAKIEIESLREEDAWTLFRKRAGKVVESPAISRLAKDVARECHGLPLALVTLGRAMRDKDDPRAWITALEQLRRSMPVNITGMEKQVFHSIKLSFDSLESDEAKFFFLFCGLFPEDYNINIGYLTRYLVGEGLLSYTDTLEAAERHVLFVFENLKASSLLLEGNAIGRVKMHDVVRDVAVWIAKEEMYGFHFRSKNKFKKWYDGVRLEEFQRISLMHNNLIDLPDKPVCQNLRTLLLSGNRSLMALPTEFFKAMDALMVLDLSRTRIASLPASLPCLVNLTTLCLDRCLNLKNLSWIGKLKKLEILSLQDSGLCTLPREIGELTNLRCLDLTGSHCTIQPGVISKLSMLEQLYVAAGFNKWQAKDSTDTRYAAFAELVCLSRLTDLFIDVEDDRCFYHDLGHGASDMLRRFCICPKSSVKRLDGKRGRRGLTSKRLVVVGRMADWAMPLLKKVEDLSLVDCAGKECLLRTDRKILSGSFSNIKILELIRMQDLSKINNFFPSDGLFKNLNLLIVDSCEKLVFVMPRKIISMAHQLEKLKISNCPQLQQVFKCNYDTASIGEQACNLLPKLGKLKLSDLPSLKSIWEGYLPQGSLRSLKKLSVYRCNNLKHLFSPELASTLRELVQLGIAHCEQMDTIFSSNMAHPASNLLPNLEILTLECLHSLKIIWEGDLPQGSLQSLKKLSIDGCNSLKHLLSPQLASALRQLVRLDIAHCEQMDTILSGNMISLPSNVLPDLKTLTLRWLPSLKSMWEGDLPQGSLQSLKELSVQGCKSLEHLFSTELASLLRELVRLRIADCEQMFTILLSNKACPASYLLPNLQTLMLQSLPSLQRIWPEDGSQVSLQSLKELSISGCGSIRYIMFPALASALAELRILKINNCEQLETIFLRSMAGQFIFLRKLSTLHVDGCSKLDSLIPWREIHNFRHLERLRISSCYNLKAVITSEEETMAERKSVLPKLTRLELSDLPRLSSFNMKNFMSFDWPCLKTIYVKDCSQLKKLPLGLQSAPMLESIEGTEKWFESLEWEEESIHTRLQSLLHRSE